ncbi:ATP-binding protein [Variovorax sp. J31P179]|uniref:ATP-binding protein n=1 Tax=Variovorax sp. J31P179 TaxID=3053508 RepID=UPI0025775D85|nr:ATP-binding protein [Variovorax sp. J31P179]MDM0085078.1 ATP-binding protein [Variovorax sp. J31P179]
MTTISVIVAASPHDVQADGIEAALRSYPDIAVVGGGVLKLADVPAALATIPDSQVCALILVGPEATVRQQELRWLTERMRLVVMCVEVAGDVVRLALRDAGLVTLIDLLRDLVERAARAPLDRVARLKLPDASVAVTAMTPSGDRPLLAAALDWIQALMRRAGFELGGEMATHGMTQGPLVDAQRAEPATTRIALPNETDVATADAALTDALAHADIMSEPIAALSRRLALTPIEFRFVLLALAPELDSAYQNFMARLLHQDAWRFGTLGLCAALLGDPVQVRQHLAKSGNLMRWRLLDTKSGPALPGADEALRLDGSVVDWLLGDPDALEQDVRLHRVLRPTAWPGASLITSDPDVLPVARLLQRLQLPATAEGRDPHWLLFNGDQTATWHATLERAAVLLHHPLLRVQAHRIAALDVAENGETARRLLRLAKLTRRPLLLDATTVTATADSEDALRHLVAIFSAMGCRAGIICTNLSWCIGLLSGNRIEVVPDSCLPQLARRRSLQAATQQMGLALDEELLDSLEQQVPLQADGWERALRLTRARGQPDDSPAQRTQRFVAACRDVAAATISDMAVRLQPHCTIDDVVLPDERKQQLRQIVDSVKFARRVLDEWKFGEQLNYGRGVCALFHGPSGTGKSMSALAIAQALNSQVLRIDLSQVVSKYIGETEKHLDAVFRDASQCGAVLLVDEADALLGKRGELKDAHDRYAAQEVSYLLTRIESYDGVAVFTTNARQSIDPAFLRRLRFIVEFPRPDAEAREDIWRRCLGTGSHELHDAAYRQLARKLDLTGGHIRQIALQAAFLAAAADRKITLADIAAASRAELAKLGLPPIAIEPIVLNRVA